MSPFYLWRYVANDQTVGQLIYRLSGGRIFSYPEERDGFELPEKYKQEKDKPSRFGREEAQEEGNGTGEGRASDSAETVVGDDQSRSGDNNNDNNNNGEKKGEKKDDTIMVDWYSEDDPENPQNWYVPPLPFT